MLVDYGSDSEGSGDDKNTTTISTAPPITSKLASQPLKATPSLTSSLPKPRRREGPLKITLEAPKRSFEDESTPEQPPTKKVRREGAGGSALLAMLPPPKNTKPTLPVKNKGGEVKPFSMEPSLGGLVEEQEEENEESLERTKNALSLVPPSRLAKGKEPAKPKEEAPMDFFSLGTISSAPKVSLPAKSDASFSLASIKSSAPSVKEFRPPTPTPQDPYPGYYQKPSGEWAMHDPEYYWSVANAWSQRPVEDEMNRQAGPSEKRKGKAWQGDEEDLQQVSAMDEASRTRAEIEGTKSLTVDAIKAGPAAPNMTMTAARQSNRAKSRHQLSTLLVDAYSNRAQIEEKIATARRNRKESGNKYGF